MRKPIRSIEEIAASITRTATELEDMDIPDESPDVFDGNRKYQTPYHTTTCPPRRKPNV